MCEFHRAWNFYLFLLGRALVRSLGVFHQICRHWLSPSSLLFTGTCLSNVGSYTFITPSLQPRLLFQAQLQHRICLAETRWICVGLGEPLELFIAWIIGRYESSMQYKFKSDTASNLQEAHVSASFFFKSYLWSKVKKRLDCKVGRP